MVQPREGFCLFYWKKMDKNVGFLLLFPENYKKVDFITKVFPVCSDIQSVNKQIKKLQHFSKKCCSFCFVRLSPYNRNFKGVFMDIYTILSTIFRYSLLALGGIAALVPLYAAGFLIYKKVFHGTK